MKAPFVTLSDFKRQFDPVLEEVVREYSERIFRLTDDTQVRSLVQYVDTLLKAGGKRIRPYAAYLMYLSVGGQDEKVLRALASLELFHLFALVHDDIIDESAVRHGVQTLHHYALGAATESSRSRRIAEGKAILVGDLVFSWSERALLSNISGDVALAAHAVFGDMIDAVVTGQMLDVQLMDKDSATIDQVMRKTELKTAHYTFIHPMRLGAVLSGEGSNFDTFCISYGTAVGLAFQIQDDLLDIVGDTKVTGKTACADITEGQHTVFTQYIRDTGDSDAKEELSKLFRRSLDDAHVARVRTLMESSGALAHGKGLVEKYFAQAHAAIDASPLSSEAKDAWIALTKRMETRTA